MGAPGGKPRELAEESAPTVPRNGQRGYFPDHAAERREEFARTTPGERVAEGVELSRFATRLAASARTR